MNRFETCPECGSSDYTVIENTGSSEDNSPQNALLQCDECGAAWDAVPGWSSPQRGQVSSSTIEVKRPDVSDGA